MTLLSILAALGANSVPAQQPPDACSLLTATELGAAFGGTVTPHKSNLVIPDGPAKGQPLNACMWSVGEGGMFSVSVMRAPQDAAARQAGLAKIEQTYAQLRAQGWTEVSKDVPGAKCALMTPPVSLRDAPVMTGCLAEAKGMAISVSSLGKTRVQVDQVKPLLDKVIQRLP
jgi:hypothetical protein